MKIVGNIPFFFYEYPYPSSISKNGPNIWSTQLLSPVLQNQMLLDDRSGPLVNFSFLPATILAFLKISLVTLNSGVGILSVGLGGCIGPWDSGLFWGELEWMEYHWAWKSNFCCSVSENILETPRMLLAFTWVVARTDLGSCILTTSLTRWIRRHGRPLCCLRD